jgi:hypothetical protein
MLTEPTCGAPPRADRLQRHGMNSYEMRSPLIGTFAAMMLRQDNFAQKDPMGLVKCGEPARHSSMAF